MKNPFKSIWNAILKFLGLSKPDPVNVPVPSPVPDVKPKPAPIEVEPTPVIIPTEPPIVVEPLPDQPKDTDVPQSEAEQPKPDPVIVPITPNPEPLPPAAEVPKPPKEEPKPEPVIEVKPKPEPVKPPVIIPETKPEPVPPKSKALKDIVPFTMGVAVQVDQMKQKDYVEQSREFANRVTFVNDLKMKSLQNEEGEFDFRESDAAVNRYLAMGMTVHGHTLVYDAVVNKYFKNFTGTDAQFESELRRYVQTVVKHFAGRVTSWDVLNEPWDETGNIQQKLYVKRLGLDYMKKVFIWAHEADPKAILLVNDYNLQYTGKKTKALVKWLKECIAEGVPVHGVGNQMHTNTKLDIKEFKEAVKMVTDLGMIYHVSELEVKVFNPTPNAEQRAAQTKTYLGIFDVIKGIPTKQNMGITLWGLAKPFWFENAAAGKGKHIDDPLLLSDNYQPSPAYHELVNVYSK